MRRILQRCIFLALAGFAVVFAGKPHLLAGENYALLVAVGDYDPKQLNKLPYTRNDVIEFRELLLQSGFKAENIVLMHDDPKNSLPARLFPESAKIRRQLTLILSGRDDDDTVILAFAGHGIQYKGDETSYYCPLDVDLEKKETLIPLKEIYDAMKACGAKKKLLLVDACRNDPRSPVARSRSTVDLESVTRPQKAPVPESVLAFFSCAPGQQSFEWPDLKHGVFFYHVLDVWKNGAGDPKELTLDDLVYQSRKRTEAFARNNLEATQTPELHGKSAGKWVLRVYREEKVITNSLGMKLLRIPAGEYLRGASAAEIDRLLKEDSTARAEYSGNEQPQHRVRITKDFLLGRTEVTQAEWQAVMGSNPSYFSASGDGKERVSGRDTTRFPVETVSWYDAAECCNKLSAKEGLPEFYRLANIGRKDGSIQKADVSVLGGKGYRLPTEAEWEYACRAGTTTRYHFGDSSNGRESNVDGNNPLGTSTKGPHLERTTTVGSYAQNAFGLVDMHGNVWEWCQDGYDANEYKQFASKTALDPVNNPGQGVRVIRGGSWDDVARSARSALRDRAPPGVRNDAVIGFRFARTP